MTENVPNNPPANLQAERQETLDAIRSNILSVGKSIAIVEENESEIDWDARHARLDYENRLEKKTLRSEWNKVLTYLVVAGFFFSYLMIILIGFDVMNFDDNAFAVPSVVAAGVIQTFGLAKLAIQYFFSEDSGKSKRT